METLILLSLFAFACLFIGWYVSRNITGFRDFILAKDLYNTFALTATIVASFVGGGFFIGTIEKTFQKGIAPAFALLGFSLQLILTGYLICTRRERFKDCYSVGDIMRKSYGKNAQIFTGLLWMSFSVGIVTAQLAAMGKVLVLFTGLDYSLCVFMASAVVIAYCMLGGIRAVVATDILQFIMIVIILGVGLLTFFSLESSTVTISGLLTQHIHELPGSWGWDALFFAFFGFLFGDALIAPIIQRIIMAKSAAQAKTSFILSGLITVPLCLVATLIGLYTLNTSPDLASTQVLPTFLHTHFSGLSEALIVTALMAVIISSADTYLNSAASVFVNDAILPLKPRLTDKTLLNFSRLCTFGVGLFALCFALFATDTFDLLLYTYKFWGPILLVPLVYTFYGNALNERDFFTIAAYGAVTVFLWNILDLETSTGVNDLFSGLVASCIGFIFVWQRCRSRRAITT